MIITSNFIRKSGSKEKEIHHKVKLRVERRVRWWLATRLVAVDSDP